MPRPTRWKGCVNGLKGRVRACFICPPIRLTSTPSKWPGPKLSSSCARLKGALWKHLFRRLSRAYKLFFLAMLKASSIMTETILTVVQVVSLVIIIIIMAVMANTMAMTARERQREYATLKALGFGPAYILLLILGESLLISLGAGIAGILLLYPVAERVG